MESYGLNEAIMDLAELETGSLSAPERVACVARVRNFIEDLAVLVHDVEQAGAIVGDDQ